MAEPAKKCAKKVAAATGATLASAGAAPGAQAPAPIAELLSEGFIKFHEKDYIANWAGQTKRYVDDHLIRFLKERTA